MARIEDAIAEQMEAEIIAGTLPPGARLDEPSLAQRFGVSRTPVRAALQRLAASGLIELRPRATRVVQPSPLQLFEMFETMAELEAGCARLAALRADPARLAALAASLTACETATDDLSSYYAANLEFHRALYAASGNGFLAAQAEALHLRLTPFRRHQLRLPRRIEQSLTEHRMILTAIREHDPDSAARIARGHIAIQGEGLAQMMSVLQTAP